MAIRFPYPLRFQHCYLIGKTGYGKTTAMQHLALMDCRNGAGFTFIDPSGDAVLDLLARIPESRKDDVIYISLEHPIPFDFMSHDPDYPTEKDELVKDLVFILLKGIPNAPIAEGVLMRLFYTLLSTTIPTCFLDVHYFLTDKIRQKQILAALPDAEMRESWKEEVPKQSRESIILRMTPFLLNSALRNLFGTPAPKLRIAEAMNSRKILLMNIGGASSAAIEYGSLLFAKIKQEVFRRHTKPTAERVPHFLFIDEFQKFTNPETFYDTLMMARKYKLAMTLASPTYHDLDAKLQAALGIISSYVFFNSHTKDLSLSKHYFQLKDEDEPLKQYEAFFCLGSQPPVRHPVKNLSPIKANYAEYIRKRTLVLYTFTPEPESGSVKDDGTGRTQNEDEPPTLLPDRAEAPLPRRDRPPRDS